MIDILKSPAEGSGGFVVLLDVADQLSGQVSCRSEDPASDDIALDFGKPDLDLIKPAGIGRGVNGFEPLDWLGGTRKHSWFYVRSSCQPRCESRGPQADWRRSGPESRQTRRWYGERWSLP